jgi:hypothetical protein
VVQAAAGQHAAALSLARIATALGRGGRQRRIDQRAAEIAAALRSPQLQAPPAVAAAIGASVTALVAVFTTMNTRITGLARELEAGFEQLRNRGEWHGSST